MSGEGALGQAPPLIPRSRGLLVGIPILLVATTALAFPLTGCGESKQEQAKKSVCSAKSNINSRITTLKTISPSVATLPQIKTEVTGIVDDLKQINSARGDLEPARKQQVQQATHTFEQQLNSVVSDLTSSFSLANASSQLESALRQLATSYAQALGPIECS
jgi:hypothetical protein